MNKLFLISIFLININCFSQTHTKDSLRKIIAVYNKKIQTHPKDANSYRERGNSKFHLEDYQEALKDFNTAIKLSPEYDTAYYQRGNLKAELKDYKGAIEDYNIVTNLNSKYSHAYYNRGVCKLELQDYQNAIVDFDKAIGLNPSDVDSYASRATCRFLLEDYPGSIKDNSIAIKINPLDISAFRNRALGKLNLDDARGAIEYYSQAIKLDSLNAETYSDRGYVNFSMKNYKKALEDYRQALKLVPDDSTYKSNVKLTLSNLDSLPSIETIVSKLEENNQVEGFIIGYNGAESYQWELFQKLNTVATDSQLTVLTNYKNSCVRCYSFQALIDRKSNNLFPVLLEHLHDTSYVMTLNGCIGEHIRVGDYFIELINNEGSQLTKLQIKTLDSIMIYDKSIELAYKETVLKEITPTTDYYKRIHELVEIEKNQSALMILGKYKKQKDKKLIASFFHDEKTQFSALYAVREFPDPYFYPYVIKVFKKEWGEEYYDYSVWKMCYQALAQYPDRQETMSLFEKTTKVKQEFKYETLCKYLLVAITKYPNPIFESLKSKIKLGDYGMSEVKRELKNDD